MNKNDIDRDAEREAAALKAVGNERSPNRRVRLAKEYNQDKFDRLFNRLGVIRRYEALDEKYPRTE